MKEKTESLLAVFKAPRCQEITLNDAEFIIKEAINPAYDIRTRDDKAKLLDKSNLIDK